MTSSDDDTFLSAYLDGELDLDRQQAVESALVSSPDLADRLRGLSVVRDLVASLHRDAGPDVADVVMSRIGRRRPVRSIFAPARAWAWRGRRTAAVAGVLTVAAGLLIVVTLAAVRQPRAHQLPPGSPAAVDNVITDTGAERVDAGDDEFGPIVAVRPSATSSGSGAARLAALGAAATPASGGEAAAGTGDSQGDLELSRRLLDSPYRRRFFLSKGGGDGQVDQRVASVVERTTRSGFFKITVAQGIVIDPRHPDQATVFALLVKPDELDRLRDQLRVALPDLIEESTADPAIVTQLADIGRVQSLAPYPLADVLIARDDLALRTRAGAGADSAATVAVAGGPKAQALPTAEQFRSAPVPAPARTGSAGEADHGTEALAAEEAAHRTGSPAAATTRLAGLDSAVNVAQTARSDAPAPAAAAAQPDDLMLVFVWICKPRAS